METTTAGAASTVVYACADHRLKHQGTLVHQTFGEQARRYLVYGGLALYLVEGSPAPAHGFFEFQLGIARSFGITRVVEVYHGGAAPCAGYRELAGRRGLLDSERSEDAVLLELQLEAARTAGSALAEQGLAYEAWLYQVDSLRAGHDDGRLLPLLPEGSVSEG